jgi:hypothetical protein
MFLDVRAAIGRIFPGGTSKAGPCLSIRIDLASGGPIGDRTDISGFQLAAPS